MYIFDITRSSQLLLKFIPEMLLATELGLLGSLPEAPHEPLFWPSVFDTELALLERNVPRLVTLADPIW